MNKSLTALFASLIFIPTAFSADNLPCEVVEAKLTNLPQVTIPEKPTKSALQEDDFSVINRCTVAATISLASLEYDPNSPLNREAFILRMMSSQKIIRRYAERMPTQAQMDIAHASIEALVSKNGSPKTPLDFQHLAATAGASCALNTRNIRDR
jgi:hypothetical protein